MAPNNVYIVSAARTPIGNFNGALASLSAADLGAVVMREVLTRASPAVPADDVQEIIMGQVFTAGAGQNPARQAAFAAGIPQQSTAWTLNLLCGSGLKSVALGWQTIASGAQDVMICGGQESMTNAPHVINMRGGVKLGNAQLEDSIMRDGLTDAMCGIVMGQTAENVAKDYAVTRAEQDAYALLSQQRCAAAQASGFFEAELVPVEVAGARGAKTVVAKDEFPRNETSAESLAKLKPCFVRDGSGTVTAGNASGINDVAAAVLLMSETEVKARSAKPLARIVGFAQTGMEPRIMGMGPVTAIRKLLKNVDWPIESVDLFEINEAFASISVAVARELQVPEEKVNVFGGSIALGHPLGASGTRVLITLISALRAKGAKRGVASLCVGGGMGVAMAIELV